MINSTHSELSCKFNSGTQLLKIFVFFIFRKNEFFLLSGGNCAYYVFIVLY